MRLNARDYDLESISDSFTILGLWVLGLAVSNINESPLQTNESKTLFLMTSLPYYCILGLAEIKNYAQKMQDAQVTKSLSMQLYLIAYLIMLIPVKSKGYHRNIGSFQNTVDVLHYPICNLNCSAPLLVEPISIQMSCIPLLQRSS